MSKPTPFQAKVYAVTKLIPVGRVSTYKEVAEAIGCPNGARAVGSALKVNPFAPEVPCHRVIKTDLSIGGFFGDTSPLSESVVRKRGILSREGVEFDNHMRLKSPSLVVHASELVRPSYKL